MAKSLRSKIKRRYRTLKRKQIEHLKGNSDIEHLSQRQRAIIEGIEYREPEKKNAFLHPEDPTATFPQYKPQTIYDLRSGSIPIGGNEFAGAYRKKINRETIQENVPEIEIVQENIDEEMEGEEKEENVEDLEQMMGKIKLAKKKNKKLSGENLERKLKEIQLMKIKKKDEKKNKKNRKNFVF